MQKEMTMAKLPAGPEWLTEYRKRNLAVFMERPVKKSKYTNISALEEMLVQGTAKMREPAIKFPNGAVKILSVEEALEKMPGKIQEILSKEEKPKDQFDAFVNAYFDSGFVIIAKKDSSGTTLEIEIPEGVCAKYFIIAEKGADVGITERIASSGNALVNQTVYLEENSSLALVRIHLEKSGMITHQQCIAERDAKITNCNAWFGGSLVKAKTSNILEGNGSSAKECSLLLADGAQHFDLGYTAIHRAEATESHCMFKSALRGASRNVFDGMIRIEPTGAKTNALLECHSMILGEKASSNQIPGLEIKTDDVKATHSATVSRIDEDELFYLESRGLPEQEASKMVVKSFLESVVYMLPETMRGAVLSEIEARI